MRRSDPTLQKQGYLTADTFSVSSHAVEISYARQIATQFLVGGHLRYAREDLGDVVIFDELQGEELTAAQNELSNIEFDFGTIYYPGFEDLPFGMSLRNLEDDRFRSFALDTSSYYFRNGQWFAPERLGWGIDLVDGFDRLVTEENDLVIS